VFDVPRPGTNATVAQPTRPNQHLSEKIIWTLNHDATPIYAIQPKTSFAHVSYDLLLGLLGDQLKAPADRPERASIAGTLGGSVTLLTGQVIPVIHPDIRGMFNWRIEDLIKQLTDGLSEEESNYIGERIQCVFTRIYYEFRNLGLTPQDRALNFAVTIGTNMVRALSRVRAEETKGAAKRFELDDIQVVRSPVCRPDSDCWDVKLSFFD